MKKTMNEIIQVKYVEEFFSPEIMDVLDTWCVEFNQDGIVSYHKKYKSRKREDVIKVAVPCKEMKSFFSELYKFVRTADCNKDIIDDCSHTTTIIYSYGHKEIIEGCPFRGDEQMLSLILGLLAKHGISDH